MNIFGNGLVVSQKEDNKLGEINNEGCNIRKRKKFTFLKKIFLFIQNIQRRIINQKVEGYNFFS